MNPKNITKQLVIGCLFLLTILSNQAIAHDDVNKPDSGVTMRVSPAKKVESVNKTMNIERRITARPVTRSISSVQDRQVKKKLTVEQAIAAAITQTAVLFETRSDRQKNTEATEKRIVVRGSRLTMSYTQDLYERHCYLAAGARIKWRTVNGFWAGRRVDTRSLAYVVKVLHRNGISLDKLKITVNTADDMTFAKRIVHSLRLGRKTIIELDPEALVHVKVTFNRN